MIGRERERRRLHDVFETAVADRSCQLFTVLGPAGVGKSRLVQEFLGELGDTALVARGRCLPYGEGITYWPLLEAVKEAVGLTDADSPDEARAKLIGALAGEAGAELIGQQVAGIIGLEEAARLDGLDDGERSVIETASVDGQVFHEGVVTALLPETQRPLAPEHLKGLVRKELIRPDRSLFAGDRAFRFRHLLIRDAAYDSIPKEARAAMHEAYADWLEDKAGRRTAEFDEIIGYHLEQAYRYRADLGPVDASGHALARRAADRLAVAARRAFVRTDVPAAVKLILRAVSLLPPGDPARVDLVPTVRVAQALGGAELAWAFGVLDEAIGAGDDQLRAHALVQRGLLRLFTGPDVTTAELIRVAKQAIDV